MSQRGPKRGLDEYRRKRSAQTTPEPFGGGGRSRLFVVQQHAARRMHYDLRLEWGGVLLSWAVPKGASFDPAVKRLAVHVEDHPVDYAEFEGVIPEGNYGAGAVIVWDRGSWLPVEDPEAGLAKGKLLFDLAGHKLKGRWTLFRTSRGNETKEWLLVKKPDTWAGSAAPPAESILSGLTVEQMRDGADPAADLREQLRTRGVPVGRVDARRLEPMLARVADEPFSKPGWLFELKYDGFRMIAARENGTPFLRYRRGQEATGSFPEIARTLGRLPYADLVLDGEVVVADETNRPSFRLLQQRVHLTRPRDIEDATVRLPATLFAFDLLACEGFDLRSLPLERRKRLLREVVPPAGPIRYADHYEERGQEVYAEVGRLGFEGVVAKKADAPYTSTRSAAWLKVRADRLGEFAIVGYTRPKGSRQAIGALHLACRDGSGWTYAGRVGTGLTDDLLGRLSKRLDPERVDEPACERAPKGTDHVWVRPDVVCEVRYKEWTGAGSLRHPVFVQLREDRAVEDCEAVADRVAEVPAPPSVPPALPDRKVPFTNLDKVFWPDEGYTKGDLIEYYRKISPWLLPYLVDRPVVLTRFPDGIHGKSFYQKDAPAFVPEWIRTETMWSEHARREIHYFVVEDEASLAYLANLGTIPLHLWSSRVGSLQHPDWCILDLDPKRAPFSYVVRIARSLRALCTEIGLDSFVKTSGSTGLHVLLPLGGRCTYEQSRLLAELLARVVVAELGEMATLVRAVGDRGERVYVDYLQNGHGRLLVSPYSVRPLPGAPVSAPLRWREVDGQLDIRRHTIRSMPRRLARMKHDPFFPVLERTPDLDRALAALAARLGGS